MEIRTDRAYVLDAPLERVWEAISAVDDYRSWWPWLRGFDASRLEVGERWACTVRPPLGYELRFIIEHTDVRAPMMVRSVISGDIEGDADLALRERGDSTELQLRSRLRPRRKLLRTVARFSPWLASYGHDWVLDRGFEQFEGCALQDFG
ncbi:MAG: SRPBCC domain-containing protein [Acidobacteria bacterium]|nr:SRPBCC domain-containing protein [Acidobacteriota bacterium]